MSEIIQGSQEWLMSRCGLVTASRIVDVMAKKTTQAYRDYLYEIAIETMTGKPTESTYTNSYMEWGTEQEPFARARYELVKNEMVEQVGLIKHPRIERSGASPDGLVSTDGMVEIKCPKSSTHCETIVSGDIPKKYELQMLWQMACCERQWVDFVSYDPRLPEDIQIYIKRFPRDDKRIAEIELAVVDFLKEVDDIIVNLNKPKGEENK